MGPVYVKMVESSRPFCHPGPVLDDIRRDERWDPLHTVTVI